MFHVASIQGSVPFGQEDGNLEMSPCRAILSSPMGGAYALRNCWAGSTQQCYEGTSTWIRPGIHMPETIKCPEALPLPSDPDLEGAGGSLSWSKGGQWLPLRRG